MTEMPKLTKKDFTSDQEVRWCPGCGDYTILAAVQMMMPKIGKKKEDVVFVSGIGCSSRFPYYMNTYGMHTIHGRACAIATGLKCHNPDLSVWVITGDGDGLSIGGNHTIHAVRRNIDVNILLFNNEIYGLTKGQYSPTSRPGTVAKSTPYGSIDNAFQPSQLALGAGATFFARTMDTDVKHMQETFLAAAAFKGCSFVEVLQNCIIFNDKIHDPITNRATKEENVLYLTDGAPMLFGKDQSKGIMLDGLKPKVVEIGKDGIGVKDILVHDTKNAALASILALMKHPEFPVPMGVLRSHEEPTYNESLINQIDSIKAKGSKSLQEVVKSSNFWVVK
jgi:2-oxoglutarate ferredoxin oxidoreductase subunit beta